MDLKGLTIFFVVGGILSLLIYEIKKTYSWEKNCFHYRRNYVTIESGIARCDRTEKIEEDVPGERFIASGT